MMMKFYILAVLFIAAQAKEFEVKDANKTCAMLTLDGQVNLAAESTNGSTNGTVKKTLKIEDATLIADSNCTLIKLNMTSLAQVWFQFEDQDSNWRVTPIAAFVPEEVFGSAFNDTVSRTFVADPLHAFTKNESYACTATITKPFKETSEPSKQYNYTVSAETSNFQIQSLDSGTFAEAEHCSEDKTTTSTTTPTTPTTSTKTSPTSATTATPTPPTQNATCTSEGITRIRMAGVFALSITYNATEKGKDVQRTVYIPVPPNADTTGSKCDNSTKEEVLSLGFFNGWLIEYTFDTDSSDLAVGAGSGNYYVSSINITYKYDEHLPGAKDNGTVLKSHTFEGSNFLKATPDGYFSCKANVTTAIVKNEVSLITKNLKYKAFNNKGDAEFKGDVSECDQDEDTSSVVPIAVGAALAGLVVIVLISYLIGRKRSRKSGYESV